MDVETMNVVITSIIIPVLVALVALFVQYTAAKAAEMKIKLHNEEVSKYVDIAEDAVVTAVGATAQVLVDTLKDLAENGQLSDSQQAQAFAEARNRSLAIMGIAGREAVKELYGSFDDWIANKIDYYVGQLKIAKGPVINTVTVATPIIGATTTIITSPTPDLT